MPDKTDWEALMDGAFGRRSRPAAETSARRDAEQARRELEELMARQPAAPAALQKNAARLADAAADQAEQIRRLGGEMTENLRRDGLLPQKKPAPAAPDTAFAGLAEQLEQTVIGQPDFVRALVRAFRRPFVLGYAPGGAPQHHPDLGRGGHRAAFCPANAGRSAGGKRGAGQCQPGHDGPGPLSRPRAGKAVFAGSVRGPHRAGADSGF